MLGQLLSLGLAVGQQLHGLDHSVLSADGCGRFDLKMPVIKSAAVDPRSAAMIYLR